MATPEERAARRARDLARAQSKGFNTVQQYRNYLARQKGYKSLADQRAARKAVKDVLAKEGKGAGNTQAEIELRDHMAKMVGGEFGEPGKGQKRWNNAIDKLIRLAVPIGFTPKEILELLYGMLE